MAATLLSGLYARFKATIGADFAGGWFVGQAPDGSSLPLVVVKLGRQDFQWTTEATYQTQGPVTLYVFGKGAAAVETLASELTSLFNQNWGSISIANASVTWMLQNGYTIDAEGERAADNEQVFRAELSFEVKVAWTLV